MTLFKKRLFWLWGYVVVMLFVMTFLVPPFQKPDEVLHFKRAYSLSLGQFACVKDTTLDRGYFSYPTSFDEFQKNMLVDHIIMKYDSKFPLALYKAPYPINSSVQTKLTYNCTLPFVGYIPHAVGILLTKPFDNILISFFASRLMSGLVFFLLVLLSYRMIPDRYKGVLLLIGMTPMVLHQATSVSYDAMSISLGIVIFSYFIHILEKKFIHLKEIIILMVLLTVFMLVKPGYYLLYGILLPLFPKTEGSLIKKIIVYLLIYTIAVLIVYGRMIQTL